MPAALPVALPDARSAAPTPPRSVVAGIGRRWLRLLLAVVALLAPPGTAWAVGCSAYMGQVVFNEVRVGKSNASDTKNQIELYNTGGVAQAVWKTWSVQVWLKDGTKAPVRKGTYAMSSGHTANGNFIYNTTAYWLQNRDQKAVDIGVYDASGNLIAYFAIEGAAQTVPACFGATTVVQSATTSDDVGDIMRPVDETGAWPSALTKTSVHTIGRTNQCTAGASGDLVVAMDPDNAKAIQNSTTVVFTIILFNNSCSTNVSGVKVATTNTNSTYLGSLATTVSAGSVALSGTGHLWNIGTVNAGVTRTLTISGKPTTLGTLTVVSSVNAPTSGLVNTADDSDTGVVTVQQYNYVGFSLSSDSITEGTDTAYAAQVTLDIVSGSAVTVNFTVGGTATGSGSDYTLATPSPITIAAGSTSAVIDFTITNDALYEATKTIVLTLTSVSSADSTVRIGTVPNGDILTSTITLYDDDPLSVHHYELALPSTGVACAATTATVKACADASSPCTNAATTVSGQTATLATSAGSLDATTLTFNASGVASTTLSYPGASNGGTATVTLSGESTAAANSRQCCPNGSSCSVANSCGITYSTAGFVVAASAGGASTTVPTQTAGTSSGTYYLRAVKTGTSTQACEAALSGANTVNWSYQCNNPTTCSSGNRVTLTGSSATAIAGNANGSTASSTSVPMSFDANGNAPFSFNIADVGQMTLYASKAASGSLLTALSGSSNAFVSKPAGFVLSSIKCSSYTSGNCATAAIATPGNNPAAAGASGTAFMPAGAAFSATVTAVDSGGSAVPNYGRETSPEGVKITPTLVLPAGGATGTVANSTAFGTFTSGVATGTTFSYSEVGIVTLTPSVADGSYLGVGEVTGTTTGNVGRFIPSRISVSSGSVTHRSSLACSPASGFSYLGENFRLGMTLTAQNTSGATTTNYTGSFAKFDATSTTAWQLAGVSGSTVFSTGSGRLSLGSSTGSWSNGVMTAATLTAAASRASTPDGPFATASFGIAPLDSDGVTIASPDLSVTSPFSTPDRASVATVALRFGRLRLASAIGPADRTLALPVAAQYWDGSAWSTNTLDSCTAVAATAVNFGSLSGTLTVADTAVSSPVTITSGTGNLRLSAPGGGRSGAYSVALSLGSSATDASCLQPWTPGSGDAATAGANLAHLRGAWCGGSYVKDPAARAAFGRASGNDKLVFRRENY